MLITGAGGFLGSRIRTRLKAEGHEVFSSQEKTPTLFDLETPGAAAKTIEALAPDVVIHAAAISSLAAVALNPDRALRVNAEASGEIAAAAARVGARLAFLSSDQVFDGKPGELFESTKANPRNLYGVSKLDSERRVFDAHENALVIRLPLVFGRSPSGDRSASEMILKASEDSRSVSLFEDEWRSPASASHIIEVIASLVTRANCPAGLLHLPGPEFLTRFAFGLAVCDALSISKSVIRGASLASMPQFADRPPQLQLASERIDFSFLPQHPSLDLALRCEHLAPAKPL